MLRVSSDGIRTNEIDFVHDPPIEDIVAVLFGDGGKVDDNAWEVAILPLPAVQCGSVRSTSLYGRMGKQRAATRTRCNTKPRIAPDSSGVVADCPHGSFFRMARYNRLRIQINAFQTARHSIRSCGERASKAAGRVQGRTRRRLPSAIKMLLPVATWVQR